jgi:hypothetical protein
MKKPLMILGAILLAALVAGGSFWGGRAYQSRADQLAANQAQANFFNARGGANGGQFPNDGQRPSGGLPLGSFGGGGTTGVVKTVDGNVLTVSTAQDVTTVNLSEATRIQKFESVTISDLQPGMRVMVTGQRESSGEITASQIMILNSDSADISAVPRPPYPSPTGTEP